ncbi:putative F-box protein At3g23960 [Apium graveolens]|uniref:putative F-box protein At3g23960 n=1 Tax=Apium graveolens TaxID=4045 RepID=UPI003D78FE83
MKKQSIVTSGKMISDDLLTEIFVRLPVKTLLRCKSVSKPWLSLISNSNFIKSHLKRTITTPGADQTILVFGRNNDSISPLNLDPPEIEPPLGFPFCRGDFPFHCYLEIVGCYNGIVCVCASHCPADPDIDIDCFAKNFFKRNDPNIYLWNPATKRSKLIPQTNLRPQKKSLMAIGFGFDPLCDDFKIVWVFNSYNEQSCPAYQLYSSDTKHFYAEVYSSNTNSWRKVESKLTDSFQYAYFDVFDVCVNGLLCCIGGSGMLTAFDLNKEVFTCGVWLPDKSSDSFYNRITEFNDSIAVITRNCKKNERKRKYAFNLWMLDDEACLRGAGPEASWTLGLTIDVDDSFPCVFGRFNCGDILLETDDKGWILCNSDRKEARDVPLSINIHRRIIKYNESLVSIVGSKQVNWNAHEDDS